jgi:hypothetical protein
MSDSKDNAPKPSAPSSNDVAGNNDPNRRRRGGRNRNPRKKTETPEGEKEAGVTSNAPPKVRKELEETTGIAIEIKVRVQLRPEMSKQRLFQKALKAN